MIDPRVFPDDFIRTYRAVTGGDPPREFTEAYNALADVFYWGTGLEYEDAGYTHGGSAGFERGYTFKEPRLFKFKRSVDWRLSALASELRAWAESREGQGAERAVPARAREGQLDRTREPGAPEPDREA